ncbi:hypothetical protein PsYK624_153610 [Phanerochaete sordida]|uniref:Uncharacterized protein n=1 Tax=Phanerochaete sordida TaxID=48140 RepID=A0A9P3LL78_9APHY|nr:hypothetical protein PsYK624_153610 [Phanerochaete sordida]
MTSPPIIRHIHRITRFLAGRSTASAKASILPLKSHCTPVKAQVGHAQLAQRTGSFRWRSGVALRRPAYHVKRLLHFLTYVISDAPAIQVAKRHLVLAQGCPAIASEVLAPTRSGVRVRLLAPSISALHIFPRSSIWSTTTSALRVVGLLGRIRSDSIFVSARPLQHTRRVYPDELLTQPHA